MNGGARQIRTYLRFAFPDGVTSYAILLAEMAEARHLDRRELHPIGGTGKVDLRDLRLRRGDNRRDGQACPAEQSQAGNSDRYYALGSLQHLAAVDERNQQQRQDRQSREHDAAEDLERSFEEFQGLEQE